MNTHTDIDIVSLISEYRFDMTSEEVLCDALAEVFDEEELDYTREARLTSSERIDFLIGNVGIEVKIKGSVAAVLRQLHRYAKIAEISSLVLVTGRIQLTAIPDEINGKPVRIVALLKSLI